MCIRDSRYTGIEDSYVNPAQAFFVRRDGVNVQRRGAGGKKGIFSLL